MSYKIGFSLLFFTFICLMVWKGCTADYPEDNELEEWVEDVLKNETGADIDLSPDSPEKYPGLHHHY